MKKISTVLLAIFMAFSVQALANESYTCTHGDKQRVIEIKYDVEGQSVPCEVHYTKDTGTQRLWRAEGQVGYCESKTVEFIAKQQGWGWSCDQPGGAVADLAGQSVNDTAVAVADQAGEMKEMATEAASDAMETANNAVDTAKAKVDGAVDAANQATQ